MQTVISNEQQELLNKLLVPFDPNDISWRVTNKSRDGRRGCVIPYGDQRAYTDRLNSVATPAGWTRTYSVSTISPVTRVRKAQNIQTGKVIVTCTVTIASLGTHSGTGEMWADDDNAMTRAEAQAFKRACSCFGLGRYFYDFGEMWVDLDEHGSPRSLPSLPKWALPPTSGGKRQDDSQPRRTAERPERTAAAWNVQSISEALDPELTRRIEAFRKGVGDSIYLEVFAKSGPAKTARELPGPKAQRWILAQLETVQRGIDGIREQAEAVGEQVFYEVMDKYDVNSVVTIPSFELLKKLFSELKAKADAHAA